MTPLRPFKEIQQCPKCLQTLFSIRHSSTRATRLEGDDYLTYTCNCCGYAFNTQAADCKDNQTSADTVVAELRDAVLNRNYPYGRLST